MLWGRSESCGCTRASNVGDSLACREISSQICRFLFDIKASNLQTLYTYPRESFGSKAAAQTKRSAVLHRHCTLNSSMEMID